MTVFANAGVAGAGTMGSGIAITIARSGIPTTLFDRSAEALGRAEMQINDFFRSAVAKGRLTEEQGEAAINALTYTSDVADMARLDVIVEAIFEDIGAKSALFNALFEVCSDDTLFLTNTSTLSITSIAAVGRSDRIVGAHYCLPAQLMRLVEMSRGIHTSDASWDRAWDFMRASGQLAVETKDQPGFVLNHFCIPYHNDTIRLIEAGVAEPADIDRAVKAAMGFAMGPCELMDLVGLDTQLRASEAFFAVTNNPRTAPPPLLQRMVAAGTLGKKTRKGFYNYESGGLFGA